jgi:hypothetical protein
MRSGGGEPEYPQPRGGPILHDRRLGLKSGDGGALAEPKGLNPLPVSPENPRTRNRDQCDPRPVRPEKKTRSFKAISSGINGIFRWICYENPWGKFL